MMDINLSRLALPISHAVVAASATKAVLQAKPETPKCLIDGKFLKGPISLTWLQAASRLLGKSFHVAIALCFLVGLKKSNRVKLTQKLLNEFEVTRYSKYRALVCLSQAGLISIETTNGKNPIVTTIAIGAHPV